MSLEKNHGLLQGKIPMGDILTNLAFPEYPLVMKKNP
jgi:hypothetical protein